MLSKVEKTISDLEECMNEIQTSVMSGNSSNTSLWTVSECNTTLMEDLRHFTAPLWQADFPVAVIYCSLLVVGLTLGTFGNILTLIVSFTTRTLNRVGKDFVINLALADLCVAAVAEPMCILGIVKGERWFDGKWLLCEVVASLCLTACFCAFLSLTMMTVNRYVFVCRNTIYYKIYRKSVCVALCVLCWVFAFLFEFPNFVGWGDHYFDTKNHQCIWDRTASFSYTLLVCIGLIGGPLFMMSICFVLIFAKIYKTKRDVFSMNVEDPMRMRRVWIESFRSSRTLVIIFIAFIICWSPYAVITAMDVNNDFPVEVHLFVTLLAHSHSSLNFIIYMCSSKGFRVSVMSLFRCTPLARRYNSSVDKSTGSDAQSRTVYSTDITGKKLYYKDRNCPPNLQFDNDLQKPEQNEEIMYVNPVNQYPIHSDRQKY